MRADNSALFLYERGTPKKSNSHSAVDTTAGITEIMNLGLSNALFERHESMMEEYGNAMAIMQNLQVIDILNGIIDGFNNQLEAANENVYDSIESDIANYVNDEDGVAFAEAPFERNKANHTWSIRVCVASNLTGDKYKTRTFQDYSNYINKSVFLKPLEGLKGSKIDFTKPDSYANLDSDELQVYVDLESELLNRRIDEVFEKNGLFEEHTEKEFDRLQKDFSKYYGQWVAGEAMKSAGFYAKPMFPNGPSMMQTAVIAASLSGNPWIALAVNAVSTGIQVADGTMSLKQAGFQIAMSAAGSAIGVGADSLGNFVGGAVGSSVVGAVVKSTTMVTGNTLLSGMTYSDEGGFNWQGSRMKSWKTWAGAGITAGAGALVAGFDLKGITGASINTLGSGTSQGIVTGDWKESFQTAAINGAAGYLTGKLKFQSEVMQNASNMTFRNLFGSGEGFNWALVAQTDPVGNFFTDLFSGKVVSPWTEQALNEQDAARKQQQEDAMATLGFLDRLEMGLGGVFLSMKESLGNTMNNFVADIGEDLAGFAGDISALGAGIASAAGALWEGMGKLVDGMGSGFFERVGNWIGDWGFSTDEEIASNLKMTKKELEDWKEDVQKQREQGIEVGYTDHIEVSNEDRAFSEFSRLSFAQGMDAEQMSQYLNSDNGKLVLNLLKQGVELREGVSYETDRINQYKIHLPYKTTSRLCVFSSIIEGARALTGDKSKTLEEIYRLSLEQGAIGGKSGAYIKNYNKILRAAGEKNGYIADYLEVDHDNPGDVYEAVKSWITNLNQGNLILPRIGVSGHSHTQLINGYEFDSNGVLRFNLKDPGEFNTKYMDPIKLQPYIIRNDKKDERKVITYRVLASNRENYKKVISYIKKIKKKRRRR